MSIAHELVYRWSKVIDPEVNMDVITLGLVYDLEVDEENMRVKFKFKPTVPNCPIGHKLALEVYYAVAQDETIKEIEMEVTDYVYADQINQLIREIETERRKKYVKKEGADENAGESKKSGKQSEGNLSGDGGRGKKE